MPLWNEILTVRVASPPCAVRLLLERAPPATGGPAHPAPPPLAAFDLHVPAGLEGAFADARLSAIPLDGAAAGASDPPPSGAASAAAGAGADAAAGRGAARLRVAFSLDERHAEDIQRGLWPCGARYLRGGGGGGGGNSYS